MHGNIPKYAIYAKCAKNIKQISPCQEKNECHSIFLWAIDVTARAGLEFF